MLVIKKAIGELSFYGWSISWIHAAYWKRADVT
jgi:hypothetical protein